MADYITEAQFKERFGDTTATNAARIAEHITAASREVDGICGRTFGAGSATSRYFTPDGPYLVRVDDCHTITAVAMDTGDDGTYGTTLTAGTDYITEPYNGTGPDGQTGWPTFQLKATGSTYVFYTTTSRPSIKVTATFGWAAVPDAVVEATYLLAHRLYYERDVPSGNVPGSVDFGGVPLRRPYTAERLLAPYIRADRKMGIL